MKKPDVAVRVLLYGGGEIQTRRPAFTDRNNLTPRPAPSEPQ